MAQWGDSARLRLGALGIGAILWVYALMLMADLATAWRAEAAQLSDEVSRIQPLSREQSWGQRQEDARQQLDAIRGMLWSESDAGLIDAKLQDWLRAAAAKSGLKVRELAVQRAPAQASGAAGADVQVVRARLVVELDRLALLVFLTEVGRNEQVLAVDHLALRLAARPVTAEIELKALARAQSAMQPAVGAKP